MHSTNPVNAMLRSERVPERDNQVGGGGRVAFGGGGRGRWLWNSHQCIIMSASSEAPRTVLARLEQLNRRGVQYVSRGINACGIVPRRGRGPRPRENPEETRERASSVGYMQRRVELSRKPFWPDPPPLRLSSSSSFASSPYWQSVKPTVGYIRAALV